MDIDYKHIGRRIREERLKAGLTQAKFAELTGYADAKCISHICTAVRPAPNWRFDEFAEVINAHLKNDYVSADYLRGIVDYRNDIGLLSQETKQVFDKSDMQRDLEKTVLHLLELKGYRMVSRQLANWSEFLQAIASCADRSALAPVHYHVEKYSSMQEWKEGEHLTQYQLESCFENIAAFFPEYLIYEFETPKGKTRIIRRIELENTFRSIEATLMNGALHSSTNQSTSSREYGVDEKSIPLLRLYSAISRNCSCVKANFFTIRFDIGLAL